MYLMCPRQLFFHCGPEMPRGWTPLARIIKEVNGSTLMVYSVDDANSQGRYPQHLVLTYSRGGLDKATEALGEGWWETCSVGREHSDEKHV